MSPPLTIESSGEDAGAPYDSRAAAFDPAPDHTSPELHP